MTPVARLTLALALLPLAACVGGGGTGPRAPAPVVSTVPGDTAGAACHGAVASAVRRPPADVVIYDRRAVAGGTEVRATTAGKGGLWSCRVAEDGTIAALGPLG
jgi:hypothetical protein